MPQTITFDHADGGFDLVAVEDLDGRTSLRTKEVAAPISAGGGTRTAHVVEASHITRTVADFPDDYDAHPQALTHYVQTLTDQHAPSDKITVVYGPDRLARKLAVLLDAEYGGADAPELDEPVAADTTSEV